jgi:hypothetical protein
MKKLLIILAFVLGSCEIQPKTIKADDIVKNSNNAPSDAFRYQYTYDYEERTINNMTYGIWFVKNNSSQTGYDIECINITKDMLEVELLRKQLTK